MTEFTEEYLRDSFIRLNVTKDVADSETVAGVSAKPKLNK